VDLLRSQNFRNIVHNYELKYPPVHYSVNFLNKDSHFCRCFMKSCVDPQVKDCKLEEKDIWIIEAFFILHPFLQNLIDLPNIFKFSLFDLIYG
jgi:hypothetical protein